MATFLRCALLIACLAAAPCRADTPQTSLPLTPDFVNTEKMTLQDVARHNSPRFSFAYDNTTDHLIDYNDTRNNATISSDDQILRRIVSQPPSLWPDLSPGKSTADTFALSDFLPGAFRPNHIPLGGGLHTVSLTIGDKTYGPATYISISHAVLFGIFRPSTPLLFSTLLPVFVDLVYGQTLLVTHITNTPEFAYAFVNTTTAPINIPDMEHSATITLDGQTLPRIRSQWTLRPDLRPGESYTENFWLTDFVPNNLLPSSKPLANGLHTITLHLGNHTYGPVPFNWETSPA